MIRANSEELIALECVDIGMPITQMHGLAARAADNFDYFAGVITELAA
jgi:5-carboxymethyl-2-hydroxymuconic-semialdehyde dehydrogenase